MRGDPVLDGVEGNVIHVGRVVGVIADRVFPISTLPDTGFTLAYERRASVSRMRDAAGKQRLDRSPTGRKIGVAGRQSPHAMEMVRQNDEGVDMKWPGPPRFSNGVAQGVDFGHQKMGAPIEQIDREEITASRDSVAAVVRHRRASSKGWAEAHPTRFSISIFSA